MQFYLEMTLFIFIFQLSCFQCGQGGTYDQLRPTCVNSLSGVQVEKIAAGLWHTLCVSADGCVYAFGGNQFGQLGTGADQAEVRIVLFPLVIFTENESVQLRTFDYGEVGKQDCI